MSTQNTEHNPDNLTPEQVGVSDGWRLLDADEVLTDPDKKIDHTQVWWCNGFGPTCEHWPEFQSTRTRLTRPELRAARGLPPILETSEGGETDKKCEKCNGTGRTPNLTGGWIRGFCSCEKGRDARMSIYQSSNPDADNSPSAPATPAPAGDEATPRTDSCEDKSRHPIFGEYVHIDFARTLERSLGQFCSCFGYAITSEDSAEQAAKKVEMALKMAQCLTV